MKGNGKGTRMWRHRAPLYKFESACFIYYIALVWFDFVCVLVVRCSYLVSCEGMTFPNLTSNGLLVTSETPRKHVKSEASRPDSKSLKPVPPNFFYRRDENTPPTPRLPKTLIGSSEKRKYDALESGTGSLGRPAKGFAGIGAEQGKRRRVMGEVDENVPDPTDEFDQLERQNRKSTKRMPLFMPSPSPEKRKGHGRETAVGTEDQADRMVRELLEGLDDPRVGLFDDELDLEPAGQTVEKVVEKMSSRERAAGESLKMHDWMKVGDDAEVKSEAGVKTEAVDDVPLDAQMVKSEPTTAPAETAQSEFSDAESEYADDFDYEAIDLEGIATDRNASTRTHAEPPPTTILTYPVPNPAIHDPTSNNPNFEPVPWRRCVVESATTAPPAQGVQRFGNQAVKVLMCRVVDSIAASSSSSSSPTSSGKMRRIIRCTLKGEWADLVLAAGKSGRFPS